MKKGIIEVDETSGLIQIYIHNPFNISNLALSRKTWSWIIGFLQ